MQLGVQVHMVISPRLVITTQKLCHFCTREEGHEWLILWLFGADIDNALIIASQDPGVRSDRDELLYLPLVRIGVSRRILLGSIGSQQAYDNASIDPRNLWTLGPT